MTGQVRIIGDSHIGALNRAFMAEPDILGDWALSLHPMGASEVSRAPYFEDRDGRILITHENFLKNMTEIPVEGSDYIGVSMPYHTLGMVRRRTQWAKFAPATLGRTDRQPISEAALREILTHWHTYNFQLLELLRDKGIGVFVLEAPKLFAHNPLVNEVGQDIALEIDRISRETVRDHLDAAGIATIPCPECCYDPETGLMLPEFRTLRQDDAHHASTEWGALMLRSVRAHLDETARAAAE